MRSPAGGEIGEAPPVADEASRFRGSAPIGGHDSARESVGTTVGKRAPPLRTIKNPLHRADRVVRPYNRFRRGRRPRRPDRFFPPPGRAHGPCPTKILRATLADRVVRPYKVIPCRGRCLHRPEPGLHRSSCDVSLRDQRARWSWQSVTLVPNKGSPCARVATHPFHQQK